jgi:sarcosine oxidase subunit gamma
MPDPILQQSPLSYLQARDGAARAAASCIRYAEIGLRGHVNLRGNAADPAFADAAARALGTALPTLANTTRDGDRCTVYWLGPDEWLVVTPGENAASIAKALAGALRGVHSSVTDVSGGQTILVLRGASVRELLAKGCPLDLHPAAFAPGACAQSHLARAAVLLRPLSDEAMEIIVRRSFADYLWAWIEAAGAEYGLARDDRHDPASADPVSTRDSSRAALSGTQGAAAPQPK